MRCNRPFVQRKEYTLRCHTCCPRQGLRVHYHSQTAAPSRDFPDFLLRAPAAGAGQPESGSTTEVSESEEDEDAAAEGPPHRALEEPGNPGSPASVHLGTSGQHSPLQEAAPSSECVQHCEPESFPKVLW